MKRCQVIYTGIVGGYTFSDLKREFALEYPTEELKTTSNLLNLLAGPALKLLLRLPESYSVYQCIDKIGLVFGRDDDVLLQKEEESPKQTIYSVDVISKYQEQQTKSQSRDINKVTCFNCLKMGHYSINCAELKKSNHLIVQDVIKVDPVKIDPISVDPNRIDPNRIDPNSVDPISVDPNSIDLVKEKVKVDPVDPVKIEPVKDVEQSSSNSVLDSKLVSLNENQSIQLKSKVELKVEKYGIKQSNNSDSSPVIGNGFYMLNFKRGRSKKDDKEDNKKRIKKLKLENNNNEENQDLIKRLSSLKLYIVFRCFLLYFFKFLRFSNYCL